MDDEERQLAKGGRTLRVADGRLCEFQKLDQYACGCVSARGEKATHSAAERKLQAREKGSIFDPGT